MAIHYAFVAQAKDTSDTLLEVSRLIETFDCLPGTFISLALRRILLGVSLPRNYARQPIRATACAVLCEADNRADDRIGSRDADSGGHTFRQLSTVKCFAPAAINFGDRV